MGVFGFMLMLTGLARVADVIKIINDDKLNPEAQPYDMTEVKCRLRSRLIGTRMRDEMDIVTARLHSTVVLHCRFCYEEDDGIPKIWYFAERFNLIGTTEPKELDLTSEEAIGRLSMLPDHSLVIERVALSDSGYYYCHGVNGEDSEHKFNFKVDVIDQPLEVVTGDVVDWKEYATSMYSLVNEQIAGLYLYENAGEHKHRVRFHALSEWMPWSSCNGCLGIRSKVAECRLVPSSYNSSEIRGRNVGKAASGKLLITMNTTAASTTCTPEPPIDLLGNNTIAQLLVKEYVIACQSMALAEASPLIYKKTSQARPFLLEEACYAPCKYRSVRTNQPKYRNSISLQEGDHITLVCPESTLASHVIWRKDGVPIEKHTFTENDMEEHILVDTFCNLYITYAREEESGNYTCYVNGAKIQEVIVIVNAEAVIKHAAFIRHMHYLGFMLMFGVIFYVAGVIVSWTQRHTFKQIDFEELETEEKHKLVSGASITMENSRGNHIDKRLAEKLIHI